MIRAGRRQLPWRPPAVRETASSCPFASGSGHAFGSGIAQSISQIAPSRSGSHPDRLREFNLKWTLVTQHATSASGEGPFFDHRIVELADFLGVHVIAKNQGVLKPIFQSLKSLSVDCSLPTSPSGRFQVTDRGLTLRRIQQRAKRHQSFREIEPSQMSHGVVLRCARGCNSPRGVATLFVLFMRDSTGLGQLMQTLRGLAEPARP